MDPPGKKAVTRKPALVRHYGPIQLLLLLFSVLVIGNAWREYESFRRHQSAMMESAVASTAVHIGLYLGELHRAVKMFTAEHGDLLSTLTAHPQDRESYARLSAKLMNYFPETLSFTITGPDGEPLLEPNKGFVSEKYREELRVFRQTGVHLPYIHPGPDGRHFDIMVRWHDKHRRFFGDNDEGGAGTFIVSVRPDIVEQYLARSEQRQFELLLLRHDKPELSKVDAVEGPMDNHGEFKIRPEEIGPTREPVENTRWTVAALPDPELYADRGKRIVMETALVLLGFLSISIFVRQRFLRDKLAGQKHEEVQRQKTLFEAIFNSVPDAMVIADAKREIIMCNPGLTRTFGYDPSEVVGRPIMMLYGSEQEFERQGRWHLNLNAKEKRNPYVANYRRKNGEVFLGETLGRIIRDPDGNPLGSLGLIRDITARKETEDKLRQAATVFENTSEGVMITDAELRIVAVNKAFTKVTGYGPEEVIGRSPRLLQSGRHDKPFFAAMWHSIKHSDQWQGEIWNRRKSGEVYPQWETITVIKDNDGQVVNYVSLFSDISAIKQSQAKLEYLAHHDPLTGLPNRLLFHARLEHALEHAQREKTLAAALFLDLDRFQNINDSLGHPVGDQLLRAVAWRLSTAVRTEDTVARLGGDEFTIILEDLTDARDAAAVARKVLEAIAPHFCIKDHEVYVTTSIGISLYPGDGDDVPTLVKNADTAMHRAKQQGRNNYQFYVEELTATAFQRFALENRLRQALKREELLVYYQPQFSLTAGGLIGAEALVRWQDPEIGLIPSDEFITVAEESGLIEQLDAWVLQTACGQARSWQDQGLTPVRVALNLSGFEIERGTIADTVRSALHDAGLDPRQLELEITEGYLMKHSEQAMRALEELKALGVTFTIDDFGTGYSSLAYLKRLPVDKLKIDQSFVRDIPGAPNDEAIAQAVIALGHSLKLTVIAEGVEKTAQAEALRNHGCDGAQGYLYSPPVTADEFAKLLRKNTPIVIS